MIEFDGYLTGAAQKRFYQKAIHLTQNILFSGEFLILIPVMIYAIKAHSLSVFLGCCFVIVITPVICRIQTKKGRKKVTPKRIYVNDDTIVCVSDTYTESQFYDDVKEVRDYDEFYELIFPFGKYSEKFICQKSLLTRGTFEEFEALFEGKIVRK